MSFANGNPAEEAFASAGTIILITPQVRIWRHADPRADRDHLAGTLSHSDCRCCCWLPFASLLKIAQGSSNRCHHHRGIGHCRYLRGGDLRCCRIPFTQHRCRRLTAIS
jgi:hypothetical protein